MGMQVYFQSLVVKCKEKSTSINEMLFYILMSFEHIKIIFFDYKKVSGILNVNE